MRAGATTFPNPSAPLQTARIAASAAGIRSVAVTRGANGFELQVVGLSDTRELTSATVRFRPGTTEVTIPLTDGARACRAG